MDSMLTARQVAELLGVHENWVYDLAARGELPSYKIGGTRRFVREEVSGFRAINVAKSATCSASRSGGSERSWRAFRIPANARSSPSEPRGWRWSRACGMWPSSITI